MCQCGLFSQSYQGIQSAFSMLSKVVSSQKLLALWPISLQTNMLSLLENLSRILLGFFAYQWSSGVWLSCFCHHMEIFFHEQLNPELLSRIILYRKSQRTQITVKNHLFFIMLPKIQEQEVLIYTKIPWTWR